MAVKKQPEETTEERKCECGENADFVNGICRRCRLSE